MAVQFNICLTEFGERARQLEKHLGLEVVGEQTTINAKVHFKKGPAGKLEITLGV